MATAGPAYQAPSLATTKTAIDPGLSGGPAPTVAATAATALEVAGCFMKLWEDSRYDDMYGLLSVSAKESHYRP